MSQTQQTALVRPVAGDQVRLGQLEATEGRVGAVEDNGAEKTLPSSLILLFVI